jgi:hypothetical protein
MMQKDNSQEIGKQILEDSRLKTYREKCVRNGYQNCGMTVTNIECITCARGRFGKIKNPNTGL